MRLYATLLLAVALLNGCRTTHDATDEELAHLSSVDAALFSPRTASGDMGQSSLGLFSGLQASFRGVSEDQNQGGLPLRQGPVDGARFVSAARDAWPECVVEDANGATYNDCELSASGEGASVSFGVTGSYSWAEGTSTADLTYDLSISASDVGFGTSFHWAHDFDWGETFVEGSFDLEWAYGIELGTLPSLTGASYSLNATVEGLTSDDVCDGPVSGVVDWHSTYREGTDPPENDHVTVEWLACGQVQVTE